MNLSNHRPRSALQFLNFIYNSDIIEFTRWLCANIRYNTKMLVSSPLLQVALILIQASATPLQIIHFVHYPTYSSNIM